MPAMQRRTLLAAVASGAAGLTVGPLLATDTASATADVQLGTRDVTGADTTTGDGTVQAVRAAVTAAWSSTCSGASETNVTVRLRRSSSEQR